MHQEVMRTATTYGTHSCTFDDAWYCAVCAVTMHEQTHLEPSISLLRHLLCGRGITLSGYAFHFQVVLCCFKIIHLSPQLCHFLICYNSTSACVLAFV